MKYLFLFLLLLSGSLIQTNAQNYFENFGKIGLDQVEMKTCFFDPQADAIVLSDVAKSSFIQADGGFNLLFERITRIKILNEAGKRYAEVSIPFYQEGSIQEKVTINKACTYIIAGGGISKISPLDPKSCYEEKTTENWRTMKFAMPDVQPGSIIEYTYSIQSQYLFNLHDWEFQWDIPVLYSAYEVRMIPFYEYTWMLQGRKSIDDYKTYVDTEALAQQFGSIKYNDVVYKFGLKNIPAFSDEQFIPSKADNIIKIDFQLASVNRPDGSKIKIMTTWPELVSDYLKSTNFGKYVKKSEKSAAEILDPDSLIGKTAMQKFDFVVSFAKDNFKWNNENSQFTNKTPSELQKDKRGNSAEINLWLVGALRTAGLSSDPLVLSTRKHGKILMDYPFSSDFNTVVAYVIIDGKPVLADATDPFCPNNRIPIQYMNDKGLVVNKDNMAWVSLQSPTISTLNTSIKIQVTGNSQQAQLISTASDYEALWYRNNYANNRKDLLNSLSKKTYQVEDSSLIIKNEFDRKKPFIFTCTIENKPEVINDKIYIKPFLNESYTENPLKQKVRTYPVDLTYPVKRTYFSEIVIPEGYTVQFLPEKSTFTDELFSLEYNVVQNESKIGVSLSYSFNRPVYQPEEYARVKAMFDRIVKKGNEKIVLIRK
jgi:Domain of Unknown Function with PDB structure (DUF3857)